MRLSLLALALCGAAHAQIPQLALTPDLAQQMDAPTLCFGLLTFRPENVPRAQAEIDRRGIDCRQHTAAVRNLYQIRAAEDAAIAAQQARAAMPAVPYQPVPMPRIDWPQAPQAQLPQAPRPAVNCTTTNVLGTLYTNCR